VDSLIARITLYDLLELHRREDGEIRFSCEGADCGPVEGNLALRAARLLAEGRDIAGEDIYLRKNIPPGKGLGGGSSDAAAVLVGLNALWSIGLRLEELDMLARDLGSDVPLFLGSPACRVTGRGQDVEPIRIYPFVAVLLLPGCSCPTSKVYDAYDLCREEMKQQLDPGVLGGQQPSRWRGLMRNQLAIAAGRVCPELPRIWSQWQSSIDLPVCMSGSGSALFVLCDDLEEAWSVLRNTPQELRVNCKLVRQNPW